MMCQDPPHHGRGCVSCAYDFLIGQGGYGNQDQTRSLKMLKTPARSVLGVYEGVLITMVPRTSKCLTGRASQVRTGYRPRRSYGRGPF